MHRKLRRYKRNLRLWRTWSAHYIDRHVFGAWQKLGKMRWTFVAWLTIVVVALWGTVAQIQNLDSVGKTVSAQRGGIYREGLLGQVKSVNPLFPSDSATNDVTSLIFSGLTKVNGKRELTADLAERWDVSADKKNLYILFAQKCRMARWYGYYG